MRIRLARLVDGAGGAGLGSLLGWGQRDGIAAILVPDGPRTGRAVGGERARLGRGIIAPRAELLKGVGGGLGALEYLLESTDGVSIARLQISIATEVGRRTCERGSMAGACWSVSPLTLLLPLL